jgi:hypothetical protein
MEDTLSELHFHKSCQTKVLKKISVFLSAYPGFIVFGQTFSKSYLEETYFKFSVFELYKLYIAIINILIYFTEVNPIISKELILQRASKIVYYWRGVTLFIDDVEEKFIIFGIEKKHSEKLEIKFSLSELHNFIKALKSTIVISLCLSEIENETIIAATKLEINVLKKFKNFDHTKEFVQKFLSEHNYNFEDSYKLTELVIYYYDIIILINKFSSMCQFEENICDQILSAK